MVQIHMIKNHYQLLTIATALCWMFLIELEQVSTQFILFCSAKRKEKCEINNVSNPSSVFKAQIIGLLTALLSNNSEHGLNLVHINSPVPWSTDWFLVSAVHQLLRFLHWHPYWRLAFYHWRENIGRNNCKSMIIRAQKREITHDLSSFSIFRVYIKSVNVPMAAKRQR